MSSFTHIRSFLSYRLLLGAFMVVGSWGFCSLVLAAQTPAVRAPLKVVATFSILGDMVGQVGGQHVELTTIVGPDGDAHTFEPSPADVKALAQADVLVLNGLDFETWLPRLIESAGFKGRQLLASKGVAVRRLDNEHVHLHDGEHASHADHDNHADHHEHTGHAHAAGEVDPHAWQSLANGIIYVQNITEGLSSAAPEYRAYFKGREKLLVEQLQKLDAEIKVTLADIPSDKRKVVTSHDAFGYFAQAYNIEFVSVAGLSSQAEPSAREMAAIIDLIKKEGITGVFVENASSAKLASQIARETGAALGGTLYADALSAQGTPAASYLGMFTWNAGQLIYVLKGDPTNHRAR